MENLSIYNKILSYPRIMRNNKILLIPFLENSLGMIYLSSQRISYGIINK